MALHSTTHSPPLSTTPLLAPAKTQISSNFTVCVSGFLRRNLSENNVVHRPVLAVAAAAAATHKYVYPDPIPEFAEAETQKFRAELLKKLLKEKEIFGDDLHCVVQICVEIFSKFLHNEYGGPGTLLVEPFTDMTIALKERNFAGAPLAARTSLLWAQNYVDHDWEVWNSKPKPPK